MGDGSQRIAGRVSTAPTQPLVRAIADLLAAFGSVGAPHMIIGGLAVIARGVVRHTDDADATVWAANVDVPELLRALCAHGIVGRIPDVESFATQSQVLLLVHQPSGVPMDVSLAWLPFERDALTRAQTVTVEGVDIPMATAQDLIVYKAIAWRDRDQRDVEELLRVHRSSIDLAYIRDRVAEFAEAIDEPERLDQLDAIVARVDRERGA
jgi:hypothetical protein